MIYKAWFWWCPIWWDDEINMMLARGIVPCWFLDFTIFIHNSMLTISDFIGLNIEKGYPIKIYK